MVIDKFLEVYTIQEVEKFESRKRVEADVQRRSLMGKLANSFGNFYEVSEKTGGRASLSPQKATKILQEALANGNSKFATCFAVQRRSSSSKTVIQTARDQGSPLKRKNSKKSTFSEMHSFSP